MATIKVKDSLDIEKIYVKVECPRCEKNINFHMKRPVTHKVCPHCNKVSFSFLIAPLIGYVNITCMVINGVYPSELEIKSEDVEIVVEG